MGEKSRSLAMILSFLFTGIGIIYLGNITKGLWLFVVGLICNILGMYVFGFFHYISFFTWILSLYLTLMEEIKVEKPRPHQYRRINYNNRYR